MVHNAKEIISYALLKYDNSILLDVVELLSLEESFSSAHSEISLFFSEVYFSANPFT